MQTYSLVNPTVQALYEYSPIDTAGKGYIVSYLSWRRHIVNSKGRPADKALNILGWIVGWYKPAAPTRGDDKPRQKFEGPLFRTCYDEIEKVLGYTQTQAQRGIRQLEEAGIAKRIPCYPKGGKFFYLDLIYDELVEISNVNLGAILAPEDITEATKLGPYIYMDKWERKVVDQFALEMIRTVCGVEFNNPKSWVQNLDVEAVEKVIYICVRIYRYPEFYEDVTSHAGFIVSKIAQSKPEILDADRKFINRHLCRIQDEQDWA